MGEFRRLLVCVGSVAVLALSVTPVTFASVTLVVDDDFADCPNADFDNIQAAVLAAAPGSRILVCAGTYHEQVTIPSSKDGLTLLSRGTPGTVVLDGSNAFLAGFFLENVTGVRIEGFTVKNYLHSDIGVLGGGQHWIRKNVTTAAFCGICLGGGSTNNTIGDNETVANEFGILLDAAGGGNVLIQNECRENRRTGILNVASNGTAIERNRAIGNRTGVQLLNSTQTAVMDNDVNANAFSGIILSMNSSDNLVTRNRTAENGRDGIFLANSDANTVLVNKSTANGRDGIRADAASTGNTIAQNLMRHNLEHDAHDDTAGSGTAGTANFWINNHCETQNRPGLCEHPFHP